MRTRQGGLPTTSPSPLSTFTAEGGTPTWGSSRIPTCSSPWTRGEGGETQRHPAGDGGGAEWGGGPSSSEELSFFQYDAYRTTYGSNMTVFVGSGEDAAAEESDGTITVGFAYLPYFSSAPLLWVNYVFMDTFRTTFRHEVAHIFGLFHPFDSDWDVTRASATEQNCKEDAPFVSHWSGDMVADTPALPSPSWACSTWSLCGEIMTPNNLMDYLEVRLCHCRSGHGAHGGAGAPHAVHGGLRGPGRGGAVHRLLCQPDGGARARLRHCFEMPEDHVHEGVRWEDLRVSYGDKCCGGSGHLLAVPAGSPSTGGRTEPEWNRLGCPQGCQPLNVPGREQEWNSAYPSAFHGWDTSRGAWWAWPSSSPLDYCEKGTCQAA